MEFELKTEYIELIKLLKLMGVADSGSEAKEMVEKELVRVNGEIELRKRYKVKKKDIISANEIDIKVV
jgi:ribosome-associated protein